MSEDIFKSAVIHHGKKNFHKAKEIYENLLKTNPKNLAILQNYASLLSQIREFKKADAIFKKCLEIKPNDYLLLYNYGKFFHDQKKFKEAIKFYNKSFKLNTKNHLAIYNMGNIYLAENKFIKAIASFKKAIEVNPSNFMAYNNVGIAYKKIGNFGDALKFYRQAIEKNKEYVDAHINYSTMLLTTGKLKEGLEEYEWRKKSKSFSDYVGYQSLNLKSKTWYGENLNNKKILVIAEQGIGDLIQFARYLYLLKSKYKTDIILKIKSYKFSHFFNSKDFKIITEDQLIPKHDYHIFMVSLPRILFKSNEIFFKSVNFFQINEKIKTKWKIKLSEIQGIKVGIHWSTSSLMPEKNLPLENFLKLSKNLDSNFIVLQKDLNSSEIKNLSKNKNFFYFPEMDKSDKAFSDTIEIVRNLDLVITSDTAVAHLSATLNKKTWIALPHVADWRWFAETKKTRWYENVTLFRQEKIGNWLDVFENIKRNLKKELKKIKN